MKKKLNLSLVGTLLLFIMLSPSLAYGQGWFSRLFTRCRVPTTRVYVSSEQALPLVEGRRFSFEPDARAETVRSPRYPGRNTVGPSGGWRVRGGRVAEPMNIAGSRARGGLERGRIANPMNVAGARN